MSIEAKLEGLLRIIGHILILIGLIFSLILVSFILDLIMLYILFLVVIIPWFILSTCLKLEKDVFVENAFKILLFLCIFSMVMTILGYLINFNNSIAFVFVTISISNILFLTCWHFSLSIYKKQKLVFIISGVISIVLNIILQFNSILYHNIGLLNLIPLFLNILGICLIFSAEMKMKRGGLLNYI